jgi:arylsulfatase A-like enzyme
MGRRPNIVIFQPDHFRAEALGHMGNACVHTPNLDRLCAEEAVSFTSAFCQAPVCTPSRCSFMTGWYPHVRGHRTMFHMLRQDEATLLQRLKAEGYFVWWGGKNDLVPAQHGFDRHCDVKFEPSRPLQELPPGWRGDPDSDSFFSFYHGRLDKAHSEDEGDGEQVFYDHDWACVLGAVEQLANLPEDQPFCLYMPLLNPHPPFAVEEPFYSAVDRSLVPPRIPEPEDWAGKPSMLRGIYQNSRMQDWSEERWTELRATYYAMCGRTDHQFGRVLDALREAGVWDDTAVFFFSDHASYVGDYGVVGINQNTFDDVLTHVPFICKPPAGVDIQPGTCDALIELVDFTATVEELAGLPPAHSHFGRSLLPLLADPSSAHRDAVFSEGGRLRDETHCKELEYPPGHQDPDDLYYPRLSLQAGDGPEHTRAFMCRTRTHKYVRRLYENDELYDLVADPQELHNRLDDPACAEILATLRERLLQWFTETADVVPLTPDQRGNVADESVQSDVDRCWGDHAS